MKKNKGITLIALIVIIVVLIILAGVTMNLVVGGDGIIEKASQAVEENMQASVKEQVSLIINEGTMQYYLDSSSNIYLKYIADYLLNNSDNLPDGQKLIVIDDIDEITEHTEEITVNVELKNKKIIQISISSDGIVDIVGLGSVENGIQEKNGPKLNCIESTTNSLKIRAIDVSGIEEYAFSKNNNINDLIWNKTEDRKSQTIEILISNLSEGTYYIWGKDTLGNISRVPAIGMVGSISGEINFKEEIWNEGRASVTISTSSNYVIQYQVNATEDGKWKIGNEVTALEVGDKVYARLYDGYNAGKSIASKEIKDNLVPTFDLINAEEILTNSAYYINSNDVFNIRANSKYELEVKVDGTVITLPYSIDTSIVKTYEIKYTLKNSAGETTKTRKIKVYNNYVLTNLIENSDFSNGTTGWVNVSAENIVNGVYKFEAPKEEFSTSFTTESPIFKKNNWTHIFYFKSEVQSDIVKAFSMGAFNTKGYGLWGGLFIDQGWRMSPNNIWKGEERIFWILQRWN